MNTFRDTIFAVKMVANDPFVLKFFIRHRSQGINRYYDLVLRVAGVQFDDRRRDACQREIEAWILQSRDPDDRQHRVRLLATAVASLREHVTHDQTFGRISVLITHTEPDLHQESPLGPTPRIEELAYSPECRKTLEMNDLVNFW